MFKKGLMMVTLMLVMMPMMAQAYFLTTKVNTTGGQLAVNGGAAQTSGSVMKSIPNGTNAVVVVTANAGYKLSRVQVGATYVTPTPTDNPYTYTFTAPTTSQSIGVWFDKQLVSVTAIGGLGGTISPTGVLSKQVGTNVTYTFTPNAGNNVVSLSGVPAGATVAPALPAAVDTPVVVSFAVPATAVSMQASFLNVVAKIASPLQAVTVSATRNVTIDASASVPAPGAGVTYTWTQTAGPAVTLPLPEAAGANKLIFPRAVAGTYKFNLTVSDGTTTSTATATADVLTSMVAYNRTACQDCHQPIGVGEAANVWVNWSSATGPHKSRACYACHVGAATGGHPGTIGCTPCHDGTTNPAQPPHPAVNGKPCAACHSSQSAHTATATCVSCHASALNAGTEFVQDNNGVRAIVGEFSKWSHHVTGVTLNDAHCAACHLEGKAEGGVIVVDGAKHMADNKIHLRNANDDTDMVWDPMSPSHTTMDNFCMSCHDADGATSAGSVAIQGVNGGAALNPFNDTMSNQYDKMMRGRVVNVEGQFNTANASHHAVKAKKYTGRTRAAGPRQIADTAAFAQYSSNVEELFGTRYTLYDAGRFVDTYTTLADAAGEPAGHNGGQSLGDDSTLHCGDCHTVGQWKKNAAKNSDGSNAPAAIGAHGSNNEYMLRNSIGTDELHRGAQYSYAPANMAKVTGVPSSAGNFAGQQFGEWPLNEVTAQVNMASVAVPADEVPTAKPFLVCYNCHVYTVYGSVYFSNTAGGGREGSHAFGDHTRGNYCNGPYNTSGSGRAATWTAVYGPYAAATNAITYQGVTGFNMSRLQPGSVASASAGMNGSGAGAGNIFQIQCASCHNSGPDNGFGGIHGSKINTYTDALGNASTPRRFLPGLGNVKWVPGTPTLPEAEQWEQEADSTGKAGCYTLTTVAGKPGDMAPPTTTEAGGTNNSASASSSGKMFGQWGACNDHANVDGLERTIQRPVSY